MSYLFTDKSYTSFSQTMSLEERIIESEKVMKKYPERVPIIVEPLTTDIVEIPKKKVYSF